MLLTGIDHVCEPRHGRWHQTCWQFTDSLIAVSDARVRGNSTPTLTTTLRAGCLSRPSWDGWHISPFTATRTSLSTLHDLKIVRPAVVVLALAYPGLGPLAVIEHTAERVAILSG